MSQNAEKSAHVAIKILGVMVLSALVAAGGTWVYQGEEWFEKNPRPIERWFTSLLPSKEDFAKDFYKDLVREQARNHPEWSSVQQWEYEKRMTEGVKVDFSKMQNQWLHPMTGPGFKK
jgi:hypothetical protein